MFAAHHRLGESRADRRHERPAGARLHARRARPLAARERWRAFGWDVHERRRARPGGACGRPSTGSRCGGRSRTCCSRRRSSATASRSWSARSSGTTCRWTTSSTRGARELGRRVRRRSRRENGLRHGARRARRHDERIVLLTGDLGFMAVEPFAERHPGPLHQRRRRRAEHGRHGDRAWPKPASSRSSTRSPPSRRCAVRVHPQRPGAARPPGRIVGVGGGLDYGPNGITHLALEDVAVLRPLPGLAVIAPADDPQTASAVRATAGSRARPTCGSHAWGRRSRASTGASRSAARSARRRRRHRARGARQHGLDRGRDPGPAGGQGVSARVVIVSCVRPAPTHDLGEAFADVPLTLSIESHYVDGGVGSLTAEVVAENALATRLVREGAPLAGGRDGQRRVPPRGHGLSAGRWRARRSTTSGGPLPLRRSA